jgi:hypothetical protein
MIVRRLSEGIRPVSRRVRQRIEYAFRQMVIPPTRPFAILIFNRKGNCPGRRSSFPRTYSGNLAVSFRSRKITIIGWLPLVIIRGPAKRTRAPPYGGRVYRPL